ncbi:MAG: hypothetical protein ACPGFA_08870 [Pikeienuella sp.]
MTISTTNFWRRTPAALFPVCLGMIGIGLPWLSVAETMGGPKWFAGAWISVSAVAVLFCMASYLAKLMVAPRVLLIDLNPAPGRAAVSAGSMCLLVLAAALVRLTGAAQPALALWCLGLGLHAVYALCVLYAIWADGLRNFRFSPVLFLPFVGFIVATFGGPDLGQKALSHYLFWAALPSFLLIFVFSAPRFLLWPTAIPQRAAAAILLAPVSLLATASFILGMERFFDLFFIAACAVAAGLLVGVRWLTAGGWTPLWGAFTFPLSAFTATMVIAANRYGGAWEYAAWIVLIISSAIIAYLFTLTMWAWSRGRLAPATGAATAS